MTNIQTWIKMKPNETIRNYLERSRKKWNRHYSMYCRKNFRKNLKEATKEEMYTALLFVTKDKMKHMKQKEGDRKLYYISAEFLIGKLLSNNLINLGLFDEAKDVLAKYGFDLTEVEEVEAEPSLGNGGLGRLAALFPWIRSQRWGLPETAWG